MTRDGHHEVTYRYMHPEDVTPENRLGTLRFASIAGKSAVIFARLGGVSPGIGRWQTNGEGAKEWQLTIPREAKLVFEGFARVLDSGKVGEAYLSEEARQRLYMLSVELRDGISLAASYHPDAGELDEMKRYMTLSLTGELTKA